MRLNDDLGLGARRIFADELIARVNTQPESRVALGSMGRRFEPEALGRYYSVSVGDSEEEIRRARSLADALVRSGHAETAYVKPAVELPTSTSSSSLESQQGYLEKAPAGIDARFAWTRSGGLGSGVKVFDVEGDWNLSHEDFPTIARLSDGSFRDIEFRNHGTAVLGIMSAVHNGFGVSGIAPGAAYSVVSHSDTNMSSSAAISQGAQQMNGGDVMLLEMHSPGPKHSYQYRSDQLGYIAMEWFEDDLVAIRVASSLGIIVVEAAGNGAENLDDPLYDQPMTGFSTSWRNPFRRGTANSGAILVGAGAPSDRSPLSFTNYGSALDAQGWGEKVATCGYGEPGETNENTFYTTSFGGTSSATPIVAGAIACVQGVLKAATHAPLSPAEVRAILRSTGSPQPGSTPRIGDLPDLRAMISQALNLRASP